MKDLLAPSRCLNCDKELKIPSWIYCQTCATKIHKEIQRQYRISKDLERNLELAYKNEMKRLELMILRETNPPDYYPADNGKVELKIY